MHIPNPVCWWLTFWYSIVKPGTLLPPWGKWTAPTMGHIYSISETHTGCTVTVERCIRCGHQQVCWYHGPATQFDISESKVACHCIREAR